VERALKKPGVRIGETRLFVLQNYPILYANPERRIEVLKNLLIAFLGAILISLTGCTYRTPEIKGMVLDEETKKPVEGAWVHATLQIKTKTIAGDTHIVLSVEPPHTRTDKEGKFLIPSRTFNKPPFPASFGTEVESFSINATTINDMSGGFDLKKDAGKEKIEVTIHVKPWEKGISDEKEYFSYIQALYNYCLTGRFGVEVPPVTGGCDEWELGYVIVKHERLLNKLDGLKNSDQKARYANILNQLGYLFEKKGDLKRAIATYRKLMDFEGEGGWFFKPSENKINELKRKLQ